MEYCLTEQKPFFGVVMNVLRVAASVNEIQMTADGGLGSFPSVVACDNRKVHAEVSTKKTEA